MELNQLEQLLAIEKYRTLSAAAEHLNISQPALSRSIQRLEEELEVTLFTRQRNKLEFNEDGLMALSYAKRIISESTEMKTALQAAAKARRTISIGSIAPYPIWTLTPEISKQYPSMSVQSEMRDAEHLEQGLQNDEYQLIVTNIPDSDSNVICREYCEEDLYASLPPAHPLASRNEIALSDLNGQSVLQYSDVGFWSDILKEKLPDSMFLYQKDMDALNELRRSSALPAFATNLTGDTPANEHRVMIPLTDDEVNVIFYLKYKKTNRKMFDNIPPLI